MNRPGGYDVLTSALDADGQMPLLRNSTSAVLRSLGSELDALAKDGLSEQFELLFTLPAYAIVYEFFSMESRIALLERVRAFTHFVISAVCPGLEPLALHRYVTGALDDQKIVPDLTALTPDEIIFRLRCHYFSDLDENSDSLIRESVWVERRFARPTPVLPASNLCVADSDRDERRVGEYAGRVDDLITVRELLVNVAADIHEYARICARCPESWAAAQHAPTGSLVAEILNCVPDWVLAQGGLTRGEDVREAIERLADDDPWELWRLVQDPSGPCAVARHLEGFLAERARGRLLLTAQVGKLQRSPAPA